MNGPVLVGRLARVATFVLFALWLTRQGEYSLAVAMALVTLGEVTDIFHSSQPEPPR